MSRGETEFKQELKRYFEDIYGEENCFVIKMDPSIIQGFPDLIILFRDKWAALEVKKSEDAPVRPNQPYYVDLLGGMSYAAFIYPENKEEILEEIREFFMA